MFSSFRNRFGIPGVISVIALVFAMLGGAYAASNALSGKQKKEVTKIAKKIAKKFAGKPGAAGAQGPAGPMGPAGANGKDGANGANGKDGTDGTDGTNGTNGTNGTSATVASFAGSKGTCTESQGGLEVKSTSPTAFVCNGKEGEEGEEGDPWTLGGTLPVGATETGTWGAGNPATEVPIEGEATQFISFNIPLASKPEFIFVDVGSASGKPGCPGKAAGPGGAPAANSGKFCVYAGFEAPSQGEPGAPTIFSFDPLAIEFGVNKTGAMLTTTCPACFVTGVWAVTG
jgi:hypothetical protein